MANSFVKDYGEDVSRAGVVVNDLQEQAMALRMLPANTIFQGFPRAVRDLAKQFRKEIDLVIEGGETELDKKVLEEINDPLIHIMRNAVDHGIEDPETRKKRGKPAPGTVRLSARQEGDRIIIEIADDGGGIDPEKVKAAAIRKGYLTESEARSMSDREAIYLIFEAGFSTAAIITEISGRGVGMDVVREFVVEKLKGSIDVQSELGKGTTFRMAIPLTLAIIRALLLNAASRCSLCRRVRSRRRCGSIRPRSSRPRVARSSGGSAARSRSCASRASSSFPRPTTTRPRCRS